MVLRGPDDEPDEESVREILIEAGLSPPKGSSSGYATSMTQECSTAQGAHAAPIGLAEETMKTPGKKLQKHAKKSEHVVLKNGELNFIVDDEYKPAYLEFCTGWLEEHERPADEKQMTAIVWKYTSAPGWFCTGVNLGLALDYAPYVKKHSLYIRHLKYCCGKLPGWKGVGYRGVNMTPLERKSMKEAGRFYLPSFTSVSREFKKCFTTSKNTILKINIASGKDNILTTPKLSKYFNVEAEVILSCYTLFEYVKTTKDNKGRFVTELNALGVEQEVPDEQEFEDNVKTVKGNCPVQ